MFSFAFDNGYHSNQSLEGLGDPYLEITQRASITAYGGGFFESANRVRGWSSSSITGTLQGESIFVVEGALLAPDRMGGTWKFAESSRFGGCELRGHGSGYWLAEAG